MSKFTPTPLEELNSFQFNILKDTGILRDIYPDAPEFFEHVKRRESISIEMIFTSDSLMQIEERLQQLATNILRNDEGILNIDFMCEVGEGFRQRYKFQARVEENQIHFKSGTRITEISLKAA